jgi:putative transcriptional regulator
LTVDHDACEPLAEAYVLGALDAADRTAFETHQEGCSPCRSRVAEELKTVGALLHGVPSVPPDPRTREELLDLAEAPLLPLDLTAIPWQELAPGVRYHVHREDASRGVRGCLIWAEPGSRHPRHRHQGAENILVLKGALRDERGTYGPGQICRSVAGSEHSEEVVPGEDCLCYVVYYGELEMLE